MQVTATAIVQKQNMVNGTNNLYPKNAVDIVHEETNPKVVSGYNNDVPGYG
jgi:hypothetical protein